MLLCLQLPNSVMKFLNEIYCKEFEVGENGLPDMIKSIDVRGYT